MKRALVIFSLIIFFSGFSWSNAQNVNPVKWKFNTVKVNDSVAELQFTAQIEKDWHLYALSHNNGIELPIEFSFTPNQNYTLLGKTTEPKPISHYDPVFGDTSKFFIEKVTFSQRVKIKNNAPFDIKGKLSAQVCINEKCIGIEEKFTFSIKGFDNAVKENSVIADNLPIHDTVSENTVQDQPLLSDTDISELQPTEEKNESLLYFFFIAFLGGLVGLLMPCVFPMIPMTISFFMKSKRPKLDAMIYGISIVVIFVLFGVVLSLIFGADFANIISTHWIPNILFALIFIIFAISLFGYFEITLPSKWVNRSAKMENSGGLIGIFFMALTLVLVSFSCTLPIAGAVALNSAGGSFFKPVLGMLGFSLGIAVPFTLFALFPGMLKKMPKSGGWMNTLKVVLAFVELAFALKFLSVPDQTYHWGILDREVYLAFWIVIFTMLGFYLLGKIRFPADSEMPYQKSWARFLLSIFTFTFVVYMIPGLFGAPLKAISGWLPAITTQDFDIQQIVRQESSKNTTYQLPVNDIKYSDKLKLPYGIQGYFDYHQALEVAKKTNKPIFIDFTGHGCVNCRNVENAVWIDKRVQEKFAQDFIVAALYIDDRVTKLTPEDRITDTDGDTITMLGSKNMFIQHHIYRENSQPCYFVVDTDGSVLAGPIHYELNVNKYLQFLEEGLEAFKRKEK